MKTKRGNVTFKIKGQLYSGDFDILAKPLICKGKSWTPVLLDGEVEPVLLSTHKIKPLPTPRKPRITKPKTRIQKALEKAKKLYPVGTKFTSLFGADDVVTQHPSAAFGGKNKTHYTGCDNDIVVTGKYEHRVIYDGSRWADIHK